MDEYLVTILDQLRTVKLSQVDNHTETCSFNMGITTYTYSRRLVTRVADQNPF